MVTIVTIQEPLGIYSSPPPLFLASPHLSQSQDFPLNTSHQRIRYILLVLFHCKYL